jgi:pyroglutamyl-peptidase
MPSRTLLLTGFEPFGDEPVNPSWTLAESLQGEGVEGWRVQALRLPCTFDGAARALRAALRRHPPAAVLCLGLAAGRNEMGLERVAVNLVDARIPDNAGRQPIDEPVVPGGPAAHFARLPLRAMVAAARAAGAPAGLSLTAGSYVCNHVFYTLLHTLRRRPGVAAGFLHVPLTEAPLAGPDPSRPWVPLDLQRAGLQAMLRVLMLGEGPIDPMLGEGRLH